MGNRNDFFVILSPKNIQTHSWRAKATLSWLLFWESPRSSYFNRHKCRQWKVCCTIISRIECSRMLWLRKISGMQIPLYLHFVRFAALQLSQFGDTIHKKAFRLPRVLIASFSRSSRNKLGNSHYSFSYGDITRYRNPVTRTNRTKKRTKQTRNKQTNQYKERTVSINPNKKE